MSDVFMAWLSLDAERRITNLLATVGLGKNLNDLV